ncbi:MAG: laccase domain-containing protein [Candidatus Krumholzibacteria bacterium]|nr:laccase domain-containing protein [Candidatus Krumholzibacteria bacterium]
MTGGFPAVEIMAPKLMVRFASRIGGSSEPPFDALNLGSGTGDDEKSVLANRKAFLDSCGIAREKLALCGQIHSDKIAVVDAGGFFPRTDGLITTSPGVALGINSADCFPIIIYSPPERVLAALHAGREGARQGIIGAAFEIMTDRFGVDPAATVAMTGPGICGKCYRVDEDIARNFPEETIISIDGFPHLDLRTFCEMELTDAGVSKQSIIHSNVCTCCDSKRCFSYRRDGGITGRHWTIAMIRDR